MNIIVSGWPGAGQSTLALILSKSLKYTILQGSSTFRYLGTQIQLENVGADRIKADEILEPHWGPIFEKYMQWVATNKQRVITETDISGFFTKDNKNVYSIFLMASHEVRKGRLSKDGRDKDIDYIEQRDKSLSESYKKLFNVNFLDVTTIKDCYSRAIDNGEMSIAQELELVYKDLFNINAIEQAELNFLLEHAKQEEELFWTNGKEGILKYLNDSNLIVDTKGIIREICRVFPDDVNNLPAGLLTIVKQA